MGKSTISMAIFNSKLLVITRGYLQTPWPSEPWRNSGNGGRSVDVQFTFWEGSTSGFFAKSRPIWKLYMYIYIYVYTYIFSVCVCATKTFHFARISWTQMCLKVFYRRHLVAESAAQGKLSYCSSQWRKMGLKPKWWGALKRGTWFRGLWGVYIKINR